jgi:hypothetical protein
MLMPGSVNSDSQLIHQFYVGSTLWQLSLLEFGYSHVVFIQRRRLLWFWFRIWWWLWLIFNATLERGPPFNCHCIAPWLKWIFWWIVGRTWWFQYFRKGGWNFSSCCGVSGGLVSNLYKDILFYGYQCNCCWLGCKRSEQEQITMFST